MSSDLDKTHEKFQKEPFTTVGGVASTRYPLSILFELKNDQKPHVYLKAMTKIPPKFGKDPSTTAGGVASTCYLFSEVGITELGNYGVGELRKAEYTTLCPLAFLREDGGQKVKKEKKKKKKKKREKNVLGLYPNHKHIFRP